MNTNRTRTKTDYVYGNTVRKAKPAPDRLTVIPGKRLHHIRNISRRNFLYTTFLVIALLVSGFILTSYIGLQSDITNSIKHIAKLERELNNLKLANEENYSRITNNVDLDYVRRVAITELGMIYATEGQIIDFASNNSDYVRQINPLPQGTE